MARARRDVIDGAVEPDDDGHRVEAFIQRDVVLMRSGCCAANRQQGQCQQ
ncbi:MAG: hypothetical protein O2805_00590 [Proteobacteria bacterium]|nr:hypothetical protein [Pseudomonadota bacterium]